MINNDSIISAVSMFCYLFLFIAFTEARKNRIIHSFDKIVAVISDTIDVEKIFVSLEALNGEQYELIHRSGSLDGANFSLKKDNPIIKWPLQNRECMLISEFKRTTWYKSMWEEEKMEMKELDVQCILPMMDEQNLVGMVLLSSRKRGRNYGYDELNFLKSIRVRSAI